ncbi:MAG: ArsR/SmtB family transcription factor [Candidatus Asgardarchaeia archaeon]
MLQLNTLNRKYSELNILRSILSETRINILKSLVKEPKTAFQLSKELGLHTSTIYRNLDVLGAYGLVRVFRVEEFKHLLKKYYMVTLKGFYVAFDFLKDLSYAFFYNFEKYIALRWNVEIPEECIVEYAKLASTQKLIEAEYDMITKFLKETPFTLEDLNDLDTFLTFVIYVINNTNDEEVKNLEIKKIKIHEKTAKKIPKYLQIIEERLSRKIESAETFLRILKEKD